MESGDKLQAGDDTVEGFARLGTYLNARMGEQNPTPFLTHLFTPTESWSQPAACEHVRRFPLAELLQSAI